MSRTLSVGLVIGASLASGFGKPIATASDKLTQLQKKSETLKIGANIGRDFQALRAELIKTSLESARAGSQNENLKKKVLSLGAATARAKIEAEKYGFTLGKVAKQTQHLETMSKQAEARIGRMQARMERAQQRRKLRGELRNTVAIGAALFAFPMKKAMDFEQSIAEVGAITRASAEDMKLLGANAREMGRMTKFTASEAASAQKYLGMAGFDTGQIIAAMPGMMNLAAAGAMDLAGAADIASNILTGFSLGQENMGRVADVLTLAANSSNTSVQQMGHAFKYVAPIAKELGFSIEQSAAVISKLSDAGIQGEMAGTTMRGMLASLVNPTKEAAGLLSYLGVKTMDAKGALRSLPDILRDMDTAMTKRSWGSAEKARGNQAIFGARAGTGASAIRDAILGGDLDKLTAQYQKAGGAAAEASRRMNETTKGALLRLGSAVESVGIDIGTVLLPPLADLTGRLAVVVGKVSDFCQKNPQVTKMLVGAAAGFIALKAASLVGCIGFSHLLDGVSLLNGGFQMLRPSSIQAAIGIMKMKGIGGILTGITAPFKYFAGGFMKDMSALKNGIGVLYKGILMPFKFLATGFKIVSASIVANPIVWVIGAIVVAIAVAGYVIYKNWSTVKAFLLNMWDGVKIKWGAAKAIFIGWWDSVKISWDTIGDAIKAPFVAAFEWIGDKIEWIKGKWEGLKNALSFRGVVGFGGRSASPAAVSSPTFSTSRLSMPGHAIGGVFNREHVARFAEGNKAEAVIALEGDNQNRSRSIWAYSGEKLGMFEQFRGTKTEPPKSILSHVNNTNNTHTSRQQYAGGSVSIEKGAIIVNAAPHMDVHNLAIEVMRRLEQMTAQRERRGFADAAFTG